MDSYGIIGIHKEADDRNYNRGTFLNNPIQEFINNNYINKGLSINDSNEIKNHFEIPKPKGLYNLGLNSYMNSLLQCLFYIKELRDFVIKNKDNFNESGKKYIKHLLKLCIDSNMIRKIILYQKNCSNF